MARIRRPSAKEVMSTIDPWVVAWRNHYAGVYGDVICQALTTKKQIRELKYRLGAGGRYFTIFKVQLKEENV